MTIKFTNRVLTVKELLLLSRIQAADRAGTGPDVISLMELLLARCIDDDSRRELMDLPVTEMEPVAAEFRATMGQAATMAELVGIMNRDGALDA